MSVATATQTIVVVFVAPAFEALSIEESDPQNITYCGSILSKVILRYKYS
jgi:hypothetical protein